MNNEFEKYDKAEDLACEELLRAVGNFLALQPKNKISIIDFDRHRLMMQVAADLKALLTEAGAPPQAEVNTDPLYGIGTVRATLDDLAVMRSPHFADLLARADDMEIYKRTDGKFQLDFTFHSVTKSWE